MNGIIFLRRFYDPDGKLKRWDVCYGPDHETARVVGSISRKSEKEPWSIVVGEVSPGNKRTAEIDDFQIAKAMAYGFVVQITQQEPESSEP